MNAPFKLGMLIQADASGVGPATAHARKEVESVGTAARGAAGSLDAMSASNERAAATAQRAIDAARGQAAAERELRAVIDRNLGIGRNVGQIGTPFARDTARAADIEAYGRALDQLRARYNPLYAEITRYRTAQAEIRQAHILGAISSDEMAAALGRERQAALASIAALKGRGRALREGAMAAEGFHSTNIMFQLQDIGMMAALGQSPVATALQQGPQIGGIIQQMGGGRAAAGALRGALLALVSPANLAAIAITGVTAAAIQYFTSGRDAVESLDDVMTAHLDSINALSQAYGDAGDAADRFGERSIIQLEAAERRARALLETTAADARNSLAQSLSQDSGWTGFGLLIDYIMRPELRAVDVRFAAFAEPIKQLRQEIAQGRPDFEAFQRRIEEIAATDPGRLRETADEILGLADPATDASRLLEETADGLRDLSSINPDTSRAQQQIQKIADVAEKTVLRLRDLYISGSAIRNMLEGMEALARGVAPKGDSVGGPGAMDRAQAEFDAAFDLWRRFGYDNESGLDPDDPKNTRSGRRSNPWRDLVKDANDQIDSLRGVAQTLGMTGVEADAYRFRLDLLQRATDKGRQLDEEKRKEIERLTGAYKEAASEVAFLMAQEELRFEREQMFRNPTEQRVYDELRRAGLGIDSEEGQAIASQIRLNEQLEYSRDLLKGVASDLRNAWEDGKITLEEWGDIAENVIDKVIDKIEDQLIAAIMQAGNAFMSGGGGGGPLGAIGSLLGFGGGFSDFEYAWTAAAPGLWANGGAFLHGNVIPFANGAAFSNSIVTRPTLFPLGIMGEAGEEAIMPLRKGPGGRLGVEARISGGSGAPAFTYAPSYQIDARGAAEGVEEKIRTMLAAYDRDQAPRTAAKAFQDYRRAGELD